MTHFREQLLALRVDSEEILDAKVKELEKMKSKSKASVEKSLEAMALRGFIDGIDVCLSVYDENFTEKMFNKVLAPGKFKH